MNRLFLLVISLSILGCNQAVSEQPSEKKASVAVMEQTEKKQKQTWHKVTVKYFDFEGGFYGLVAIEGDKLLPMNLKNEYKVDGTILKVKGHIIKDMMTIQQWGQAFKITDVELIKLGKADLGNTF